jgi:hypothetical protein
MTDSEIYIEAANLILEYKDSSDPLEKFFGCCVAILRANRICNGYNYASEILKDTNSILTTKFIGLFSPGTVQDNDYWWTEPYRQTEEERNERCLALCFMSYIEAYEELE